MRILKNGILFFILCVVVSSCGRKTAAPAYRQNTSLTEAEVRKALIDDYPKWTSVYLPVRLKVSGPAQLSLSGRATMIRGEELYISFRMLGMEVASVYADKDSVFITDKYHKWLFGEDLSRISECYGITLSNLQDILLGRPALLGAENITAANSDQFLITPIKGGGGGYAVYSQLKNAITQYNYIVNRINDDDIALRVLAVTPPDGKSIECNYAAPTGTPVGWLPEVLSVSTPVGDMLLMVELTWGMTDSEWDTQRRINWRRPSGYREVNSASLLKLMREN